MNGRTAQGPFSTVTPELSLVKRWRRELGCDMAVCAVLESHNKGLKSIRRRIQHVARCTGCRTVGATLPVNANNTHRVAGHRAAAASIFLQQVMMGWKTFARNRSRASVAKVLM
jgi:hypothetical protein